MFFLAKHNFFCLLELAIQQKCKFTPAYYSQIRKGEFSFMETDHSNSVEASCSLTWDYWSFYLSAQRFRDLWKTLTVQVRLKLKVVCSSVQGCQLGCNFEIFKMGKWLLISYNFMSSIPKKSSNFHFQKITGSEKRNMFLLKFAEIFKHQTTKTIFSVSSF